MSYEDLKEYGSEGAVKGAGKLRQQGKPYESKQLAHFPSIIVPNWFRTSGRRRHRILEVGELVRLSSRTCSSCQYHTLDLAVLRVC